MTTAEPLKFLVDLPLEVRDIIYENVYHEHSGKLVLLPRQQAPTSPTTDSSSSYDICVRPRSKLQFNLACFRTCRQFYQECGAAFWRMHSNVQMAFDWSESGVMLRCVPHPRELDILFINQAQHLTIEISKAHFLHPMSSSKFMSSLLPQSGRHASLQSITFRLETSGLVISHVRLPGLWEELLRKVEKACKHYISMPGWTRKIVLSSFESKNLVSPKSVLDLALALHDAFDGEIWLEDTLICRDGLCLTMPVPTESRENDTSIP